MRPEDMTCVSPEPPAGGCRAWTRAAALMLALLLAAWPARAQETAGESAAPPAEAGAPQAAPADPQGLLLNFQDTSLSVVLEYLSEHAGLAVVQETPVSGRVSLISRRPLGVDATIELLNSTLAQQGYAALRTGNVLRIVTLADAKQRNIPVTTGRDVADVPDTDSVITHIIPLRYADAARLREDIGGLVPDYALLAANASSNSLIITDTGTNVRRIVQVVRAVDTGLSTVADVRVFQLKYADAEDTAELINEVFEQDQQAGSNQRGQGGPMEMMFRGRGGRGRGDEGDAASAQGPAVRAHGDERTNTLVVTGPTDTLEVVAEVVQSLDENPVEEEAVLVYALRNADAETVASVLESLFGGSTEAAGGARGGRARGMFQRGGAATASEGGATIGEVTVVAETDTNSVLVRTDPVNFDLMRSILDELDRPVPQVLIKVLFAEVTHDKDVDLGVEFSVLNLEEGERGSALFTDFSVGDASGGGIYRLVRGDASAALRALEEIGKVEILSRPYILGSDNQESVITVGQEVPFISDTRTTDSGDTINTITYEDIGIILTVTPHINPEGLVIMDVSPEISTIADATVPISETVNASVFGKRSAESRVAIRDGQTIVIGGLIQDQFNETVRKVPILGDIPLLGALFRRTENLKSKTELLIFLTPMVAHTADALPGISETESSRMEIVPGAVDEGVFQDYMDAMQAGAAAAEPAEKP